MYGTQTINMSMPGKNFNVSENFVLYKDKKFILKEQERKKDYQNLIGKSSNTKSHISDNLSRYIL